MPARISPDRMGYTGYDCSPILLPPIPPEDCRIIDSSGTGSEWPWPTGATTGGTTGAEPRVSLLPRNIKGLSPNEAYHDLSVLQTDPWFIYVYQECGYDYDPWTGLMVDMYQMFLDNGLMALVPVQCYPSDVIHVPGYMSPVVDLFSPPTGGTTGGGGDSSSGSHSSGVHPHSSGYPSGTTSVPELCDSCRKITAEIQASRTVVEQGQNSILNGLQISAFPECEGVTVTVTWDVWFNGVGGYTMLAKYDGYGVNTFRTDSETPVGIYTVMMYLVWPYGETPPIHATCNVSKEIEVKVPVEPPSTHPPEPCERINGAYDLAIITGQEGDCYLVEKLQVCFIGGIVYKYCTTCPSRN